MSSRLRWALLWAFVGVFGGEVFKLGSTATWHSLAALPFWGGLLVQFYAVGNALMKAYQESPNGKNGNGNGGGGK